MLIIFNYENIGHLANSFYQVRDMDYHRGWRPFSDRYQVAQGDVVNQEIYLYNRRPCETREFGGHIALRWLICHSSNVYALQLINKSIWRGEGLVLGLLLRIELNQVGATACLQSITNGALVRLSALVKCNHTLGPHISCCANPNNKSIRLWPEQCNKLIKKKSNVTRSLVIEHC